MGKTNSVFGILLLSGLAFFLTSCAGKASSANRQPAIEDTSRPQAQDTSRQAQYNNENPYEGLRNLALNFKPEDLQLSLPAGKITVYGIVMDWGIPEGAVTMTSFMNGDASLYFSSGGGLLGGGQHQKISNAAKQFVSLAQNFLGKATRTENKPLPQNNEIKFYLITNKGIYVGQDTMENFEGKTSDWLPLYKKAHEVLTELRLVYQEREKAERN